MAHGGAKSGGLHGIHRGVYAVRHLGLNARGRWMAAHSPTVLMRCSRALGGRALGYPRERQSNSRHHPPQPKRQGPDRHRGPQGITLADADKATHDGIPCTSVARTLVDFSDGADRRAVARAVDQAEVLRLFDLCAVDDALAKAGRRRGAGVLRAVLADHRAPTPTEGQLEERFLALCRAASLPEPEVNAWITFDGGVAYKADFLWREQGLVAETDGYRFHSSRRAFEHDRERDQRLALAGFTVVRMTFRQITLDSDRVLTTVKRLLARLARP